METFGDTVSVYAAGQLGIAMMPGDQPILVYTVGTTTANLYAAVKWNDQWVTQLVEDGGNTPRVEVDATGRPSILYARTTENQFRFARWSPQGWLRDFVDGSVRNPGATVNHSLALAPDGTPVAVWYQFPSQEVRFGRFNGSKMKWETVQQGVGTTQVGRGAKVAVSSDGVVHLAWMVSNGVLQYARQAAPGQPWEFETVDTVPGAALPPSLAVAPDGTPYIAMAETDLRLFHRTGANAWSSETVRTSVQPGGTGINEITLRVDGAGRPHLSYVCSSYTCSETTPTLRYARFNGTAWEDIKVAGETLLSNFVLDSAYGPHFIYDERAGPSTYFVRYVHLGTVHEGTNTVSRLVDSAGGTLQSDDGLLTLDIPPAALSAPTDISIRRVPRAEWTPEQTALASVVPIYELLPHGTTFLVPADATMGVPANGLFSMWTDNGLPLLIGGNAPQVGAAETPGGQTASITSAQIGSILNVPIQHFSDEFGTSLSAFIRSKTGELAFVDHIFPASIVIAGDATIPFTITSATLREDAIAPIVKIVDHPGFVDLHGGVLTNTGLSLTEGVDLLCIAVGRGRLLLTVTGHNGGPPQTYDVTVHVSCAPGGTPEEALTFLNNLFAIQEEYAKRPMRDAPAKHSEHGGESLVANDHTTTAAVHSTTVTLTPAKALELSMPGGALACDPATRPCATNAPMEPGNYLVLINTLQGVIPPQDQLYNFTYSAVLKDDRPGFIPAVSAPYDYFAGASTFFSMTRTAGTTTWDLAAREVTGTGSTTAPVTSKARAAIVGNNVMFFIPTTEIHNANGNSSFRLTNFAHTGNLGRLPGNHFYLDIHPPLDAPMYDTASGEVTSLTVDQNQADLQVINAADGSEAPNGDPIMNELWLTVGGTFTGGSIGIPPVAGGAVSFADFELGPASDPGCIEQWDGTAWGSVATIVGGMARFRATQNAPSGGCQVDLRTVCRGPATPTGADGGAGSSSGGASSGGPGGPDGPTCPPPDPGNPPPSTTVRVTHGTISRFFIQTPGRICEDGEPAELNMGNYKMLVGDPTLGTAADLYICAQTSFGAWLRYDRYSDDNPTINWSAPLDPDGSGPLAARILSGEHTFDGDITSAPGGGASHGYIRINAHPTFDGNPLMPNDNIITATGRMHSDTLLVRKVGTSADSQGMVSTIYATSVNVDAATPNLECRTATGSATLDGCVLHGQQEQFDLWADLPATGRIHVGTDRQLDFGSLPASTNPSRVESLAIVGSAATSLLAFQPYCRFYHCAATGTPLRLVIVRAASAVPAIVNPTQALVGVGDSARFPVKTTVTLSAHAFDVDISQWASAARSRTDVVGSNQPQHWTSPPAGVLAQPGTPEWARLWAMAVSSSRSVDISAVGANGLQSASAVWTVQP